MRCILPLLALTIVTEPLSAQVTEAHVARARRILESTPLIDGHNDLAWAIRTGSAAPRDVAAYDLTRSTPGHTDLERLRRGMVGGQFWSVYVPGDAAAYGFARMQLEQIDIARRFIAMYPERFQLALDSRGLSEAFMAKRIGSVLGMEGGHVIENSLGALRAYHALGARYLGLTHNSTTDWADAGTDVARHGGLSEFGREVVREMNRLGMLVDLSHTSPGTMSDALDVTEAPVIFSHSNARAIADVPRNVPDSILRRIPANGGVVMVTFVPGFVSKGLIDYNEELSRAQQAIRARAGNDEARIQAEVRAWTTARPRPLATLSEVADHIDHIRKVAGADHVGIGGDFDGISIVVKGLEDVSTYPALFAELVRRGWSDADLRKLAGENILRVMAKSEEVAARLQGSRRPSTKTIEELDRR